MDNQTLLIGIDLGDDFVQFGCYNKSSAQADSVSLSADKTKYRIPTCLCAKLRTHEWLVGEEAVAGRTDEEYVFVDGLLSMARECRSVTIAGKEYTAEVLLERFFRRTLGKLRQMSGGENIQYIVISMRRHEEGVECAVRAAFDSLGIHEDRLRIITHLESFMYYTVNQNKDIWVNDVGLINYDEEGMVMYRLSYGRKQEPMPIVAVRTDMSDTISYDMLEPKQMERLLFAFENIAKTFLHKQIMSAVYVTGIGFESTWADEVLKGLCVGRRVFRGQNLYTKGSCYAAAMFCEKRDGEYLPVGDDILRSSIAIKLYQNAEYSERMMADIGECWREAGDELEVIMEDTDELDIVIRNVLKKDYLCAIITLDSLCLRSDKAVRLKIRLSFLNRNTAVITVRDTGFGEFRKTNHRIWEQILRI